MSHHPTSRRYAVSVATAVAVGLALTACGSDSADNAAGGDAPSAGGAGGGGSAANPNASVPTADVVSAIKVDPKVSSLLPADVRSSGQLLLGVPEVAGTTGLPHAGVVDGKQVGLDLDIRAAVAKRLGVTFKPEVGTFATIVPGVQNGKYQVGQGNFGVTKERSKVVDFATYLNDGQSFVGGKDVKLDKVSKITDICGLTVATGKGTTFQKLLQNSAKECATLGKKPYEVKYLDDQAPIILGLQNGRIDVYFGPTLGLKVLSQKVEGTKYLGEVTKTPVGFVTAKKSPLAPALNAAVNSLIADGTYQKIFDKWAVGDSIIAKSELNPTPTF